MDTTLSDEEPPGRARARTAALVALCFLLGVLVAAAAAWKMGRAGPDAGRDELASRAEDALSKKRLIDPPGDNVRDLTAEGLRRWPGDPRLVAARTRAADDLAGQAERARPSDAAEALRLAKLARDLDPGHATAKKLVAELEGEPPPPSLSGSSPPQVPPLRTNATPSGVAPPAGPVRATLDVSQPKPRVGQPVELVGRVAPAKSKASEAEFTITGPGLAGVRLPANEENGAFRAGYTFFEAGKFDVVFSVKVDGAVVRASRTVAPGDVATPPPPASTTTPTPPPSSSVKWL